jgi:hypothetical protein
LTQLGLRLLCLDPREVDICAELHLASCSQWDQIRPNIDALRTFIQEFIPLLTV